MADLDLSELNSIVAPTDEQLKEITKVANQQLALELNIEQLEAELLSVKAVHLRVSQIDLPDAMAAINMKSFKLNDGTSVEIKKGVDASITEANKPSAFAWLRSNGHGAIIKNEFKVPFGAGEDADARKLDDFLAKKMKHDYSSKTAIHAATLKAWARAQLEEGNPIAEEISVWEYSVSKVTTP